MVPTRDHERIRQWAERNHASPAEIKRLKTDGEPAILSFVLGNAEAAEPDIYPISWESFFAQFDLLRLSMAFDEETSRFDIVKIEKQLSEFAN